MSATDSLTDYFNNFSAAKGYRKLAFIAGRPLQSAELNEQQDVILDLLSKVGKYLVSNGTIMSGGEVTQLSSSSISINTAVVQIEGVPTVIDAGIVALPAGTSIVGAAIKETLITGLQDADLLEPDTQSPHYQGSGADRVKVSGTWKMSTAVASDETFFPILTITDGVIVASQASTDNTSSINKAISLYDKGVHGSYIVNGLNVAYGSTGGDGTINLSMSSGTARIAGNQATFSTESIIALDPVSDVRQVLSEPIVFATGTTSYALRNTPVKDILSISATKTVTSTVTRGSSAGGVDTLPYTPVLSITSVVQGATTYVAGVDFKQTGDSVDWSLTGAEPSPGSTYTVVYKYIASFSATTDGTNVIIGSTDAAMLVNSSTMYIDYEFYLTRIDRIMVDTNGAIKIKKGAPNTTSLAQEPATPAGGYLSIAVATLNYGAAAVIDQSETVFMVPFSTMKTMNDRLTNAEYNIAQLSLKDTANATDPVTTKRGVIVDSLGNENMRDSGVTQNAVIISSTLQIPPLLSQMTRDSSSAHMLDFTSSEFITQVLRTKSQKINPYAGTGSSVQADIILAPSVLYGNTWWPWWHGTFMPRTSTVTVNLARFNSGEVIDVYYRGAIVGQCTANSSGVASYTLSVPVNTTYGTYEVKAVGRISGAVCRANLTCQLNQSSGTGDFSINYWGGEVPYGSDPIAQTFTMTQTADVSAISVVLTELPTNTLYVKIVPVVVGIPDTSTILALGSIAASACSLGWQRVNLKMPVTLQGNTDYAIIVATANYQGAVATARVTEYDSVNRVWVTSQANTGVLLTSSNEKTWTAIQDEDLTFKIHTATYSLSKTVHLLTMSNAVDQTTELQLSTQLDLPVGTSASFYVMVGSTKYPLNINAVTDVAPIPNASGNLELYVDLASTSSGITPKLLQGVELYSGVADTPATYQQRVFNIVNGSTTASTIRVILDQYCPSGATITPYYEKADTTFQSIAQKSSTALGNGWYTVTYEVTGILLNSTAIKLALATTSYAAKPLVKNIRTLVI